LQFLIDRSRFDEAYELTQASLKYSPKDANLLVDRGLLALRKGHASEAMASWEQALVVDPAHALAHFYLAEELDHQGHAKLAAAHYDAFLQQIARQPRQQRPAPDKVIAIVIRMADCQARASEKSEAIQSYRLAESLAAQTQQEKLQSVADVNEAALQAQQGDLADALRLYQEALQLDEKTADRAGGAQDWLAYGQFLDEQGFSPRLAYACFVKAQDLAGSSSADVSQAAASAEKLLESKQLGDLASLRRDPQPVLQAALALRP
jgi:tetratricopeptide (TPR) repeat protein